MYGSALPQQSDCTARLTSWKDYGVTCGLCPRTSDLTPQRPLSQSVMAGVFPELSFSTPVGLSLCGKSPSFQCDPRGKKVSSRSEMTGSLSYLGCEPWDSGWDTEAPEWAELPG